MSCTNFPDNQVILMFQKWPANLPDLHSIETIWDHFDKELRKLKPTNINQLQTMTEDLWLNTTLKQYKQLVDSMS